MNILTKVFSSLLGILCLFGCSNTNEEQEHADLLKWINQYIDQINQQLDSDIEKEKQGFFPHNEKVQYQSRGFIEYILNEKTGKRLEISEHNMLTVDDIKNTAAYKQLQLKVNSHSLSLALKEVPADTDEVESYEETDEYINDKERYFILHISGWGNRKEQETP